MPTERWVAWSWSPFVPESSVASSLGFTTSGVPEVSKAGSRENPQTSTGTLGPRGEAKQDGLIHFQVRDSFLPYLFRCLFTYALLQKSHFIFFCLVSSICLAPLGNDCLSAHTYFLMELVRLAPSVLLLLWAGEGNGFLLPGSLENGLTVWSLLVPSFPQAFCLRKTFLCSLHDH